MNIFEVHLPVPTEVCTLKELVIEFLETEKAIANGQVTVAPKIKTRIPQHILDSLVDLKFE